MTPPSPTRLGRHGPLRLVWPAVAAAAVFTLTSCAAGAHPSGLANQIQPAPASKATIATYPNCGQATATKAVCAYTGGYQQVPVPAGATSVKVFAIGGAGGLSVDNVPSSYFTVPGAVVTGTLPVSDGQTIIVGVAGEGGDRSGSITPKGGWGGLGMVGGDGQTDSKDTLRTSSAGGGATTVPIQNADGSSSLAAVAAGSGGQGGPSGDIIGAGNGGNAGAGWSGQNGDHGSQILGGDGGKAAGQPTGTGQSSSTGSQPSHLGGYGAGGGGGVHGGNAGGGAGGTSAGGGGGTGSSTATNLGNPKITYEESVSNNVMTNGQVILTWQN